jgi:O-antigen ligase
MWPATGGMWLMGSTRIWGYAPGLVLSFSGSLLVLLRPILFPATPRWGIPSGFGVFAALTAYVAASMLWASVPYAARWEALRWAGLLAAAWAWTQMGGNAHRWKWLLGALLLAAALNSLYALIQEVNGSRMVLWTLRPAQYGLRASGTYLCPNHFANMLAMLFPLALVLVFLPEAGFPLRLMAVYFLAVSAPALYWTQSRSGWLGMMGGLGVTLLLLAWRKSRAWLLVALVALPLLAAIGGWTAWKMLPAVRERFGLVLADPEKAGGIRMAMWRDAPAMFRDRPAQGFGGGSYLWAYPPYQRHATQHLTFDYPHNEYIQMLLEYGAVGMGLALIGLLSLVWGGARRVLHARSRAGAVLLAGAGGSLAASLIHALFDFNFHIFPNPHALVWIGGVAWGVWHVQEERVGPSTGVRRRLRWGVSAAGAAVCGYCAWLTLAAGLSYAWNLKAEMARTHMDWDEAEQDYAKALRWDGWNWQPHLGLGNLKVAQALWIHDPDPAEERKEKTRLATAAAGHFQRALERNACEMAAVFGLARAHNAMGDPETALEQLRRAAFYQHRHVFYREQLGVQLRQMGRDREALEVFRRNIEDGVATDVSRLNIRRLEQKLLKEAAVVPAP